jgi:uncharacterized protein
MQEHAGQADPPEPHSGATGPTSVSARIQSIDILRGFALFGILLVNMMSFAYPGFLYPALQSPNLSGADRAVEWTVRVFTQASFYTIFSFLFGLGFALQMRRLQERGGLPIYARRLLILLAFGLLHSIFIWTGDILHTYALVGFLLIPFRDTRGRWLLLWGLAGILLATYLYWSALNIAGMLELPRETRAEIVRTYSEGSYLEVTQTRWAESLNRFFNTLYGLPRFLALFMLGLYIGRRRIIERAHLHLGLLRWVAVLGLIIGLAGKGPYGYDLLTGAFTPDTARFFRSLAFNVSGPAMGIAYVAILLLLLQSRVGQALLAPLAAVGRMALTNYLLQSIICTTLFYGYGLGLYAQVGTLWTTVLACIIFGLQVPLSLVWLRHYRYGPMEWLWRTLTYGQVPLQR